MYVVSPLVCTLLFKAVRIFSDDSLDINACLALSRAVKLSVRILLVSFLRSAGGLLVKVDGNLGFCPDTS